MIRTTPVPRAHQRAQRDGPLGALVEHLAATRYQMSEKFEYFAIRNAAGLFDSSPLYKYRISGPDAEAFLAGVLARDIRTCHAGPRAVHGLVRRPRLRRRGRRRPAPRAGRSSC